MTYKSYSLSSIVAEKFPKYTGYKELVNEAVSPGLSVEDGRSIGDFHLARVPMKKMALYNCMDCHTTCLIERSVKDKVPTPLVRIYTEAAYILDGMEKFGPLLDSQHYDKLAVMYPRKKQWFKNKLCSLADNIKLNPNSPPQLKKLIYEYWGIEPVTKKADTQKETLELLQQTNDHEGLKILQEYRETKNRLERLESFKRSADAHLGRVTTIWWLTGTRTGRLSSGGGTRPDKRNLGNLQNIASDDLIKNALVSSLDWEKWYRSALKDQPAACKTYKDMDWFVAADYGQMEVRIMAFVCGETEMLDMFNSGKDIHSSIGSLWSGWKVEELLEEGPKRTMVKIFHFSVIYGKTAPGLFQDLQAQGVKTTITQVQRHIDNYFRRFRKIKQFINDMPAFAEKHGYVENLFGFRVPIDVRTDRKGGFWRNQAVNSPIQGAAHQVMLCALALMKRNPEKYVLIRPQLEIHDCLVGVSSYEKIQETAKVFQQLMEKESIELIQNEFGIKWGVPLKVDIKIGLRFGGLVKFKGILEETVKVVITKTTEQEKEFRIQEKKYATVVLGEA